MWVGDDGVIGWEWGNGGHGEGIWVRMAGQGAGSGISMAGRYDQLQNP